MKKKFEMFAVALICSVILGWAQPARAGFFSGNNTYRVTLPLDMNYHLVAARDLQNGEWLTGQSVDILWLREQNGNKPVVYLAANHLFNLNRKGRGALGGALGFSTGRLNKKLHDAANLVIPGKVRLVKWLDRLTNFVSLEVGGGYYLNSVAENQSRWYYTLGGKVKIPIEKLWGK